MAYGTLIKILRSGNTHMKRFVVSLNQAVLVRLACGGMVIQALSDGVSASAQTVNITNGNSSASIDLSSSAGMSAWLVDGVNILNQQSFLFRTSSGVAAPISSLGMPSVSQLSAMSLSAIYVGPQFTLTTVYSLIGGGPGSGVADIAEQIKIQNTGLAPLSLALFQFADFAGGGNIELEKNSRALFNEAFIANGGMALNESFDDGISPGADKGMVGTATSVMNDLLTVPNFTLAGPNSGSGAWALEWDRTLGVNQSLIISEDFNVTGVTPAPEPSGWRIAFSGLVVAGMVRAYGGRRRKIGNARV
jgi:hypothetical protein